MTSDCLPIDVSVVIVTWNARDLTRECLRSLLAQKNIGAMEIILVDNASWDGTPELIRSQFPGIRLVCNRRNEGFAKANNIGMRLCSGRYICLINSDVTVPPSCIATLCEYMDNHPTVGLLGPQMLGADGRVRRSCMRFPSLWNSFCRALGIDRLLTRSKTFGGLLMNDFSKARISEVDVLNGWFWVVRQSALQEVGLLDERFFIYGEDLDWCHRFHQQGWGVLFYPGASAIHYGGASSSTAPTRFYVEMRKANWQYWAKYHGGISRWSYFVTLVIHDLVRLVGNSFRYLLRPSCRDHARSRVQRSYASLLWMRALIISRGECDR